MVAVSAQQRSASVSLTMKKGVLVPIRVDDPSGLLKQHEGKTAGAFLVIGVFSDTKVFFPAMILSTDASGRNHQVVVPHDVPLKLIVTTSFFHIGDASGRLVPQNVPAEVPFTVVLSRTPDPIRFMVTGVGP